MALRPFYVRLSQCCQLPEVQFPEVEAFIDKFLLGKDANTTIRIVPEDYPTRYDYRPWIQW